MASGKRGPSVHVVPSGSKFVAKEAGNNKPLTKPTTQASAIKKAIPVAKENKSEVVIHRRDGTIRDTDSYGNDPSSIKDKKH
jgi:hypothetical protein